MTAWPGLPLGDHDTRSGVKLPTVEALLDATQHDRESLYDAGAGQLPDAPHVHSGLDSHLIVMPDVPNLVSDCMPQSSAAANDLTSWSRSGGVRYDNFGLMFTRTGGRATTKLGDNGNKLQFAGCDLLIAVLIRTKEPMTSLTVRFGITDGDVSTFETGTMAEADETQVPVGGYRRLYTLIRDFDSTGFSDDVRVGVVTTGTFAPSDGRLFVTGVLVKPCSVLAQFEPGYYTKRHNFLALMGNGDVPMWDDVLNFDRAHYLEPS